MLLLIDASRANNEQKTGVEWYAYFVIQELKKIAPPEIKVILYTREPLKGDLAILPPNWEERILRWPPRRLWTQIRLSWEMWRMKYVTKEELVLFVPAHVLPLVCPKKVITTIHDLGGLRFPAGYSWFERWYARFATRFALKRAVILTPSEFVKEDLRNYGDGKITVVPNGYDNVLFRQIENQAEIQAVLKKYNIHQPYFLSISRLEEKKNTVGIVEAFGIFMERFRHDIARERSDRSNLIHEGDCFASLAVSSDESNFTMTETYALILLGKPGYGYDKVQKTIEHSKFKNDIILPGWVETADVPYLMAGAIAFIFPSFYEGFGIPILEAMACGVPVITSNRSALPEVAGNAALLVNPYKPGEIAEAMKQLVSSPGLRQELIKRGLERVKGYSWEKTAWAIDKILRM